MTLARCPDCKGEGRVVVRKPLPLVSLERYLVEVQTNPDLLDTKLVPCVVCVGRGYVRTH